MREFDLVCFLDDLPSCAEKIMKVFHLNETIRNSLNLRIMKKNDVSKFKTKRKPTEIDYNTMDKFRSLNELDTELYNWALSESTIGGAR